MITFEPEICKTILVFFNVRIASLLRNLLPSFVIIPIFICLFYSNEKGSIAFFNIEFLHKSHCFQKISCVLAKKLNKNIVVKQVADEQGVSHMVYYPRQHNYTKKMTIDEINNRLKKCKELREVWFIWDDLSELVLKNKLKNVVAQATWLIVHTD